MTFPYQGAIAWAILEELEALGGQADRKATFQRVTERFRQQKGGLNDEDANRVECSGRNTWEHRLDTVRARLLVRGGWLDRNAARGIWRLTPAAWASFFTLRAIQLGEQLETWAEKLERSAENSAGWQKVNRTDMVQKVKETAGKLMSVDKVGELSGDFGQWSLSWLAGVPVK